MRNEFGIKELYDVVIKSTYPIEMNGRSIEAGETVAAFDKIQIANISEVKSSVRAHGGFNDQSLIYWDATQEVTFDFVQGIFSKTQLALLTNSNLITSKDGPVEICNREILESDENSIITLKYPPCAKLYTYNNSTGEKIEATKQDETHYVVGSPYLEVLVDYYFIYTPQCQTLVIGQRLVDGFLSLEGRTRVKDDVTGKTHTGIFKIPKLKLMSGLSMRLGENAMPMVGELSAIGLPTGDRNNTSVMKLYFLDDDIDSDL